MWLFFNMFYFSMSQYCAIETGRAGRGNEIGGKGNSRFPANSLSLFSPEFSPVFTVATGEIRGIISHLGK